MPTLLVGRSLACRWPGVLGMGVGCGGVVGLRRSSRHVVLDVIHLALHQQTGDKESSTKGSHPTCS